MDQSRSLREEGNLAFRSSRWTKAIDLYTRAIDTVKVDVANATEDEKEHLSALYSNRAAARIHLFLLDQALLDSDAAITLRPTWSRAHARRGEALARLHGFAEAHLLAVDLAEDEATRARHMSAAAAAKVDHDEQERRKKMTVFEMAESALSFAAAYDKYVKDGGDPEKEGLVSASTAVYAWTMLDKAFEELDEKLEVKESGEVEAVTPSPSLDIADAIITDARGFHLPSGKSHELPLSEKLRLQLAWDSKVLNLDQWIKPDVVPRDVIRHYDERVKREGWAKVKVALAHLIRGSFVAAYINEVQLRTAEAVSQYRFILGLLVEARSLWEDVSEDEQGSTFRFTFERKVKMHLVEALVDGHFRHHGTPEGDRFPLAEAQNLAEELMDDCSRRKAPGDPVSTFAFQIQPIVAAGKAFAYSLRHRAALEENRIDFPAGYWLHGGMMKACGRLYATAGKLLPEDDPEKAVNFDLRAGGVTVADLLERAAEAEAALVPPERIFGPSPRLFDSRNLVRHACTAVRASLARLLPSVPPEALSKTVKPVPTVIFEAVPDGKTWEECVDGELTREAPGDLDLAVAELSSGQQS
ncbi:tetratricopeptide repeat containing protein [Rhodotorula toruloides]|uniref:Tetratricopeptide repeat containing protein n=1 Tax=Rhodotorula toruloides TaxID=5286 RepID=A0A511KF60_RHOTO|nr:tetratricopeptide repeat containing protein [Rhodotorula toruloides]